MKMKEYELTGEWNYITI